MAERKTYTVRLKPEIIKKLRIMAIESEREASGLIEEAIEDLIIKYSPGKKARAKKQG